MEREEIKRKVLSLPVRHWEDDAKEDQCPSRDPRTSMEWTGKDHGASFKLSKHQGAVPVWQQENDYLELELRGDRKGRKQLEQDFVTALGDPSEKSRKFVGFKSPDILIWDGRTTLKPQRTK